MITTATPYFQVSCPCCEVEGSDMGMCLPVAVAGAYYFGVAGCFFGAVKSVWSGAAFGTMKGASGVKALLVSKSKHIAGRNIAHCVVNSIYTGGEWAITGIKEGAMTGVMFGFCSNHYQSITGQSFPDIKMELSLIPKVQLIERA